MKLKVLGSGSSGNCYLLIGKNETLIIECGIKYKETLKGLDFDISNVVGCLVGHEHKDHSKAIFDIANKASVNIYTSLGTIKAVEPQDKGYWNTLLNHFTQIKSEQQFYVGKFVVLPLNSEHDAAEPLNFLIQHKTLGKLLYVTDSYYCQYNFIGLDHIMIECNYEKSILDKNFEEGLIDVSRRKRLVKSHFSLANVKEFLKANDLSKVKDITLIHLSAGNSDPELFKSEIQRLTGKPVYVASKGLEIEL